MREPMLNQNKPQVSQQMGFSRRQAAGHGPASSLIGVSSRSEKLARFARLGNNRRNTWSGPGGEDCREWPVWNSRA